MLDQCRWHNAPQHWRLAANGELHVNSDAQTDFWRETQYGFIRDSGHFFGFKTSGDFTAQVRVKGDFSTLYDQAGLMVRVDSQHWCKAGAEVSDGALQIGCVLTLGKSDWSVGRFDHSVPEFWIRMTVQAGVLRVQYSQDGHTWPLLRLCPFPVHDSYWVGPMCCTPQREGLQVEFSQFHVGAPLGKDLHDLT
ncbi:MULTISPECIES: DUF1349 domain-containing protein [unclassified Pseudomonas]|uniref:DUF1349 domain-containing protein n=1 Tax=unclassified Pseudomonas TaxID=196821 RepID=UPI001CBAB007|nr:MULTISPECIES: DUF1349 domain-containing protein [unclassified Pseudomonas]